MALDPLTRLVFTFTGILMIESAAFGCGPFFEEAPPLLPYYLDRLPAKSLGELYLETKPLPDVPPPDETAIDGLPGQVGKTDRKKLIEQVDQFLVEARANYQDGKLCNKLNDMRDALASQATDAEVAEYLKWRVEQEDAFSVAPPPAPESYDEKPPKIAGTPLANDIEKRAAAASPEMKPQWLYARGAIGYCAGDRYECAQWFEQVWNRYPYHPRAEAAMFLSARCAFRASRDNPWFGPSRNAAPPTDQEKADEKIKQDTHDKAVALFHQYLKTYPHGRFVADAYGWLGALDLQVGDDAGALDDYIHQVETPGHPEVIKSALFMCQDVLSGAKASDTALFALAARHPLVAMGATYFALQSASGGGQEDTTGQSDATYTQADEYHDDTDRAKKWRQEVLPELAAQVVARKALYRTDAWPSRYLGMLAQAASAVGRQDQALALTDVPAAQLDASDDLLLARGIAFQRARRPTDAIAVYRKLLTNFPKSPLSSGVKLKLAIALEDNHQAGLAVLALKEFEENTEGYYRDDEVYPPGYAQMQFTDSPVSPDISGAEGEQIAQIVDALYNFAPVNELAAALDSPEAFQQFATGQKFSKAADLMKQELNAVLAQRCLAAEDFDGARRYLAAPRPFTADDLGKALSQEQLSPYKSLIYLNDKPVTELSGSLETLTRQVAATATPAQRAKAMMALGDGWAAARGKLLVLPLDGSVIDRLFNDDSDQALERRRENGRALGFKNVDEELENRDELRHAARWWMRAARLAPGTPLAAAARLKALEAMPKIADGSDYAFVRSVETNGASVSRQLYDRLRSECPNSVEATKEAAYWSFPIHRAAPAGDVFPNFDSIGYREQDAIGEMGYSASDYGAFGIVANFVEYDDIGDSGSKTWAPIFSRLAALVDEAPKWDTARLLTEINGIRDDVRKNYSTLGQSRYLTALDDLDLFLQERNVTPEARSAYFELRLRISGFIAEEDYVAQWNRIVALAANPALAPFQDYIDFIKATSPYYTRTRSADSPDVLPRVQDGEYQKMEASLRDFLAKYPKSHKREAARLILARAVHWLTTPTFAMWNPKDDDPDPDKWRTIYEPSILKTTWLEKFDANRAFEPLDAYDHEFPNGRYAADIRNYRGSAALRARDWPVALDAALAGVSDNNHRELRPESSLLLANIFAQLADANCRADLLKAIRQRPEAVKRLQEYLAKTWQHKDHPLRYMGDYLGDQLGFRLAEPPLENDQNQGT